MPSSATTLKLWPWRIISAAVLVFIVDRFLKFVVHDELGTRGWTGILEFRLFLNRGLAFSLGEPGILFWSSIAVAFAAVAFAIVQEWRRREWLAVSFLFATVIGGISNLIDRVSIGATIDYLIFFGRSAVNLADGLVVAGLIGWLMIMRDKKSQFNI